MLPALLFLLVLASVWWLFGDSLSEPSTEAVDSETQQLVDSANKTATDQQGENGNSLQNQAVSAEQDTEAKHKKKSLALSPTAQQGEDAEQAAADSILQEPNNVNTLATPATPLWQPKDVISDEGGYQSEWVAVADVLGVVSVAGSALSNLKVGSAFSLPVGEKPEYRIEQKTQGVNGDVNWMAVYLSPKQGSNRFGVITEGKNLLLMTLYTDKGVYYLRSSDKTTAEVSFVDYSVLQRAASQKARQQEELQQEAQ